MLEGNKLSFLIAWDLKKKKQYLKHVLNIFSYHSFVVSPACYPPSKHCSPPRLPATVPVQCYLGSNTCVRNSEEAHATGEAL